MRPRLHRACLLQPAPGRGHGLGRRGRIALRGLGLGLEGLGLAREPVHLGAPLEGRFAAAHADRERVDDCAAVAGDGEPAEREERLQAERRLEIGQPHRPPEDRPDGPARVAPHGVDEAAATGAGEHVVEAPELGRRATARHRSCRADPLADDQVAAFAGKG